MNKHLLSTVKANARRYGILLSLLILATVGAFALGDAYVDAGLPAPTVVSDKDDYAPGMTALISGKGWILDESVDIHLEEDPAYNHSHDYHDVKVNPDGTWQIEYPIEERHLGVTFTVTVGGNKTGTKAHTQFTDAGIANVRIIFNSANITSLCPGQNINVLFDGISAGGNDNFAPGNVFIAQLSSATGSFASPTEIGRLSARRGANQIIDATIPSTSLAGNGYKIRVISDPATNAADNGSPLTISQQPTTANAGADQLSVNGTSTNISGNNPSIGNGQWSIVSGTGGTINNPANRNTTFSGVAGSTYVLRWTITNGACSSSDDMTVKFNLVAATNLSVSSATGIYGETTTLTATLKSGTTNLSGKTVSFKVNGSAAGTATTDANGVATKENVSIAGIQASPNAYIGAIEASFTADANYAASSGTGNLTVNKAPATIALTGLTGHIYNGSAKSATATTSPNDLTGVSISYTKEGTPVSSPTNAGSYTASATLTNANYKLVNGTTGADLAAQIGTLEIGKAPLTITAGNQSVSYGTAVSTVTAAGTYTPTGFINGETAAVIGGTVTYSTTYTATTNAEASGVTIIPIVTALTAANYSFSAANGTVSINRATATISVTGANTFTYTGGAQGPETINYNGDGTTSLLYTNVGGVTYSSPTAPTNAGNYQVIASATQGTNYSAATSTAYSFTISKAPSTTTVAIAPGAYTYTSSAITPATVTVTGTGGVSLVASPVASYANNTNAGVNTASASYSFEGDNNHTGSTDTKTYSIEKATPTVTASVTGGTYNGSAYSGTATASGAGSPAENLSSALTFTYEQITDGGTWTEIAGAPVSAGSYKVTASYAATANYKEASDSKEFTIAKAIASVTPTGNAKTYGTEDPDLTGTLSGFVATDNVTASFSRVAGETVADGPYTISATLSPTTVLGNYDITYNTANFTIGKASSTVAVTGNNTFIYNGTAQGPATADKTGSTGAVTYSYSGTSNGDVAYAASANKPTLAGTYSVTATLAGDNNHEPSTSQAVAFTIGKAATITEVTLAAGPFTYTGSGITPATVKVTGDGGLELAPTAVYTNNVNAGTATASYSYAGDYNYLPSTDSREFTIGQATATINLATLRHEYDGNVKNATATTEPAGLTGVSISNNGKTDAGRYEVVATLTNNNYTAASAKDDLVITPRPLVVKANDQTRAYNAANPTFDGVLSGNVTADGISVTYATLATQTSNIGDYEITASLVDLDNRLANYSVTNTSGNLKITPASASITVTNLDKTYNGSAQGATVITLPADIAVNVTYDGSATAPTAAGTYAVVAALNNSNYSADYVTGSLVIAPKNVTGSITASNKVYDGNTSATITGRSLAGVLTEDEEKVSLGTSGTASFASAAAGEGKTVTATGLALSGTAANNYSLPVTTATTTGNITPKDITGTFTALDKVYDGSTTATVTGRTLHGVIGSDAVTLSGEAATFSDKNVANGKTVTLTAPALAGDDKENYSLTSVGTTTANITAKALTIAVSAQNKEYNGNANATVTAQITIGLVENDQVTVAAANGLFNNKNAGVSKPVTANVSKSGNDAHNYSANETAATTANITQKVMTIAISATNKVYNGNADALVEASITDGLLQNDEVTVSASNGLFNDKNVGTSKVVTASVSKEGVDADNYTANETASTTANITAKALTAASAIASKVYDGSPVTGTVTLGEVTGLVGSETLVITPTAGNFADANVDKGKATTISYTLANGTNGGLATNYSMAAITSSGDITPKSITGSFLASNKVYDGSAKAIVTELSLHGVVEPDAVSLTGGNADFSDKHVANGKTVTLTGASLSGTAKGNYSLATVTTTTASITARPLAITATGLNKVYDGTTEATVKLSDNRVEGDAFTTAYTSATFADPNVGSGIAINVAGISTSGVDAGNYALGNTTAATTADITKASTTLTLITSAGSVRFMDNLTMTAQIKPQYAGNTLTGAVEFKIGSVSYGTVAVVPVPGATDGTVQATLIKQVSELPANYSVTATFASTNNNYLGSPTISKSLVVNQRTASPSNVNAGFYAGDVFAWTTSSSSSKATVTLIASLKDNEVPNGDLRAAKVTFYYVNGTTYTPIPSAKDLPVGLVDVNDGSLGFATATVQFDIGSNNAQDYLVAVGVTGAYTNNYKSSDAQTIITISKPVPGGFIVGGSQITNNNSNGYIKGHSALNTDYQFDISYTKSGSNPKGKAKVMIRSYYKADGTLDNKLHTYIISTNAISTLNIAKATVNGTAASTGTFTAKANLDEYFDDGRAPVAIEGGSTFQMEAYQKGCAMEIAITLFRKAGGIWFSSNWDGGKTLRQTVASKSVVFVEGGGNCTVNTVATTTKSVVVAAPELKAKAQAKLTSYPNPFTDQTTIEFAFDKDEDYNLVIYSANGSLVKTLKSGTARANTPVQVTWGDNSVNVGVYIIKLVTTNGVQTMRVVRK